jgi:AAA+ superfamily predicted ATPase
VLQEITEDEEKYEFENQLLSSIVDPKEIDEGWSDIVLDADVKEGIMQIMGHMMNQGQQPYGTLKRGSVGGALLYGPPGTGKTHLARVLASKSDIIMISISAAEIESKWVGETEKAIKGLFNLARMITPCIIFIDEADALFDQRGERDSSYKRSRVNQLLQEMDGLVKSKSAPFVLLASNFPQQLDHAVLRRVPRRLYIGLPSVESRASIFEILLREERLHPDVDIRSLSRRTERYTGSDIQALCVQAALCCNTFVKSGEGKGLRLLKQVHFEKALQRTSPTVSKSASAQIHKFASEFDPLAVVKMREVERRDKAAKTEENTTRFDTTEDTTAAPKSVEPVRIPTVQDPTSANVVPNGVNESDSTHRAHESSTLGPLSYEELTLKPNSTQLRILTIEPAAPNQIIISCTLEVVDLSDWTSSYRDVREMTNDETWTSKRRFSVWQMHCLNERRGLSSDAIPEQIDRDHVRSAVNKAYDLPLEDLEGLEDRYTWGDFIALSYVWGSPTETRDILVNGHTVKVTTNLHAALLKLKASFEVVERRLKVWVDAVCINQADMDERSREVKKMDMIYSEALAVRCWLGTPSQKVSNNLPLVQSLLSINPLDAISDIKSDGGRILGDRRDAGQLGGVAIAVMLEPYWERLWIMQEIALAPSLTFWYGEHTLTTETIVNLAMFTATEFFHGFLGAETSHELLSHLQQIAFVVPRLRRFRHRDSAALTVRELIAMAQFTRATDPRDKVYGLLALLPNSVSEKIVPDYKKSVAHTYLMFSKACLLSDGNLDRLARSTLSLPRPEEAPSWCFNLSQRPSLRQEHTLAIITEEKRHNADSGLRASPVFSEDDDVLSCRGVFVDAVDVLGNGIDEASNEETSPQHRESPWRFWSQASSKPSQSARLALARVLCLDSNYEFSDGPTILDMPWMDPQDLEYPNPKTGLVAYGIGSKDWRQKMMMPLFKSFMFGYIHRHGDLKLCGLPLRSYFTATKDPSFGPESYIGTGEQTLYLEARQLFTTQHGRIGSCPQHAKQGDKIAVLFGSDMLAVLRPKGRHQYEYIGSCFVEGLMKGEGVMGSVRIETISIA